MYGIHDIIIVGVISSGFIIVAGLIVIDWITKQ